MAGPQASLYPDGPSPIDGIDNIQARKLPEQHQSQEQRGVPVAILTTTTFDATTVDPLSVSLDRTELMEAHGRGHLEDADGDGDLDLVLHFPTQDTGIMCGAVSASITGETFGGQAIQALNSIQTVGCK